MDCPRCKSIKHCKAGFAGGRQRHKCKECGCYYTVERKSDVKPTVVGQKKTAVGYGLLLIDLENGTSILSVETGQQQQE